MKQNSTTYKGDIAMSIWRSSAAPPRHYCKSREKASNPTSKAQKKINERMSALELWRTVMENFSPYDPLCTLTFSKLPERVALALAELLKENGENIKENAAILKEFCDRELHNFIRRLRTRYVKFGIHNLQHLNQSRNN